MADHNPDTNPTNDPDLGKQLDLLIQKIKAEGPNLANQTLSEPIPAESENPDSTGMKPAEKSVTAKPQNSVSPVPTPQTDAENTGSCANTNDPARARANPSTNPPKTKAACNNHHAPPPISDIKLQAHPLPDSASAPLGEQEVPPSDDQAQIEALDELLADQAEQAVQADLQDVFSQMAELDQIEENQTDHWSVQEVKGIKGSCNSPEGTTVGEHENQITGHFENNAETTQPGADGLHEKMDCDKSEDHQTPTTQPTLELREQDPPNRIKVLVNLTAINHVCQMINRPVAPLPPSTRNLIGIVGLITLFNGSICCFYGIAKIIF